MNIDQDIEDITNRMHDAVIEEYDSEEDGEYKPDSDGDNSSDDNDDDNDDAMSEESVKGAGWESGSDEEGYCSEEYDLHPEPVVYHRSGPGLGTMIKKKTRKIIRAHPECIAKEQIKRIGFKVGVEIPPLACRRLKELIGEDIDTIVCYAVSFMEYRRRKTVCVGDVYRALRLMGRPMMGNPGKSKRCETYETKRNRQREHRRIKTKLNPKPKKPASGGVKKPVVFSHKVMFKRHVKYYSERSEFICIMPSMIKSLVRCSGQNYRQYLNWSKASFDVIHCAVEAYICKIVVCANMIAKVARRKKISQVDIDTVLRIKQMDTEPVVY